MFEADIYIRPLSTSILDVYKVFEPLECCPKGMWVHPYTVPPAMVAPDWGILSQLWSGNDAITSWLRLPFYSNCFPHPYKIYTKCLSTLICCPNAHGMVTAFVHSYTHTLLGSEFGVLSHLWSQNDVITSWLRLTAPYQTSSYFHIRHI